MAKEPGHVYILINPSFREDFGMIDRISRPADIPSKELTSELRGKGAVDRQEEESARSTNTNTLPRKSSLHLRPLSISASSGRMRMYPIMNYTNSII